MRLNPHYPPWYLFELGHAYYWTGRTEEAMAVCKKVLTLDADYPTTYVLLAAIYSELGQEKAAQTEVAELLRLSPNFSLGVWFPYKDSAESERLLAALRKAGLK